MNSLGLTESDKKVMHEAGFPWKALEILSTHDYQKWIENVSVCHTKESSTTEAFKLCIKVEDGTIVDASCVYQGCPALAVSAATVTELIRGKTIDSARNLKTTDVWQELEGLPPNHEEHVEFAVDTLKETLTIYENQKKLTATEHENYKHLCGLTGKEIDETDILSCDSCPLVQNCENDHIVLE